VGSLPKAPLFSSVAAGSYVRGIYPPIVNAHYPGFFLNYVAVPASQIELNRFSIKTSFYYFARDPLHLRMIWPVSDPVTTRMRAPRYSYVRSSDV
jgi:hypothetical protein